MKKAIFWILLTVFSSSIWAGEYDGVWVGVMDGEVSYWQLNQVGDLFALTFVSIDQSDAHYRVFYGPLDDLQQIVNGDPLSTCNRNYQIQMTSITSGVLTSKNETCGDHNIHSLPINKL